MENNCLVHHGILGMKWGVRRFQNKDGSLTSAGRSRYGSSKNGVSVESKKTTFKQNTGGGFATEKEFNDWVAAGMPKRESKTVTYEYNTHQYKTKGNNTSKDIDKEDYDKARKYDQIGMKAVNTYMKSGKEEVAKLLSKEFKNKKFDMTLFEEKNVDDGNSYVTFQLQVYGDKSIYSTSGQSDYTDEQYFRKRKS